MHRRRSGRRHADRSDLGDAHDRADNDPALQFLKPPRSRAWSVSRPTPRRKSRALAALAHADGRRRHRLAAARQAGRQRQHACPTKSWPNSTPSLRRSNRTGRGPGDPFRQTKRFRRRRRHRASSATSPTPPTVEARAHAWPRDPRPARSPAIADRRGDPRLLPRRRAGTGARLRHPHRRRGRQRSDFRKCCSACIPGLGGTVRLTRLINPMQAMTMMLTGKTERARRAKSLGLVDAVTQERHVRAAVKAAVDRQPQAHAQGLTRQAAEYRPGAQPARRAHAERDREEGARKSTIPRPMR